MSEPRRLDAVGAFLATRYRPILAGIVALGALLRVAVYFSLKAHDPWFDSPALDSQVFLEWATEIAAGDVLGDKVFFLNPLYPYVIAPLVKLFGPEQLPIRVAQMLLGLTTVPVIASATRRFLSDGYGLAAALLFAVWPLLLYYELTVMIVTLAVFLNAVTLLLLARLLEKPTIFRAALTGIPLGLAVLARPNVGLFAVLLPIWLLSIAPPGKRLRFVASRTAVIAAAAFMMVLPVTIRNYVVGQDLVLVTSSGGVNLHVSNNPKAREQGSMMSELRPHPILIEKDAITRAERATGSELSPSEVSAFWTRRAIDDAKAEPLETLGFAGKKLLMFFGAFEIPSSYPFARQREETPVLRMIPVSWGLLSPLMLLGLVAVLGRRRELLPFALLYLAYAVGLAIFFPVAHYRAPVLPGAIPLALVGAASVARPLLEGRLFASLKSAAPLVAGITLVVVSGSLKHDDVVVYQYSRGMLLLNHGDINGAKEAFEIARDADPASWLPHKGLAVLAGRRNDLASERRHVDEARRLNPNDPEVVARLARNLYETGSRAEGIEIAETLARAFPNDGVALTTLAALYRRERRTNDALGLYREAEGTGLPRDQLLIDQSICLRELGRHREALDTVDRGLSLAPGNGQLRYERAFALIGLGAPRPDIERAVRAGLETWTPAPRELLPWMPERRR